METRLSRGIALVNRRLICREKGGYPKLDMLKLEARGTTDLLGSEPDLTYDAFGKRRLSLFGRGKLTHKRFAKYERQLRAKVSAMLDPVRDQIMQQWVTTGTVVLYYERDGVVVVDRWADLRGPQ